ncbi:MULTISPECIES: fluoride efflux transporter CrcB [Lysobacteraceae]|jgi:CrcB protein|uniref:Fluoride-specific ion channel FluC n=1 Tax=Agrilutibacter niabensis TaxID=380628 RepID=A0ABU1VN43_9GAMM|nr:fluoride efflux transporter CrcB [Lysobacter niabensis]MDR7098678.1 CrcB protein [Lysobacter niabensis]
MNLWFQQLWLVMLGGALGAGGRYFVGGLMLRQLGDGFPWGTFAVNLVGAFAGGFLAVWLEGRGASALYWRAFLVVGLLGGLTTYSALMIECLLYSRSSRTELAFLYLLLTVLLGLLLVWGGARIAHLWRP